MGLIPLSRRSRQRSYRRSGRLLVVAPGIAVGAAFIRPAFAQETVSKEEVPAPTQNYSPNVDQNHPNRVFRGDTHLHTSYATDAGMVGCTPGPDEAYRFARGEEVRSSNSQRAELSRAYDFLVVSDHSENLGLAPMIDILDPILLKNPVGKL